MATLRFQVQGELGSITLSGFLGQIQDHLHMLKEYDLAISHENRASLEWMITDVSTGSIIVETESRSTLPDRDFGFEVTTAYFTGWERIENDGSSPPYLTERGIRAARRIAQRIGQGGMNGVVISGPDRRVTISERASENINVLLPEQDESLGSAEGTLETISIHRGRRFVIYHSRTKKAIQCDIPSQSDLLDQARDALGNRVVVGGRLHTNARGEPVRISVEKLRTLREGSKLPSIASLGGRYPDITGDLTTEDYIRSLREC
jgi:hypothetical protein